MLIAVKAVPGARRDEIAGLLGERVKIRVSAPAEGGRANEAICHVLAEALGVRMQQVNIVSGHISPEKSGAGAGCVLGGGGPGAGCVPGMMN